MYKFILVLALASLSGCAQFGNISTTNLAQSKPLPMYTLDCEGYVVFSGLPIPLGVRMTELDTLCKAKQVQPMPSLTSVSGANK